MTSPSTPTYSSTAQQMGGETWEEWSDVPLVLSEDYFFGISADDYTGASNGNTIAFLFADAFYDLFFIKSDDNGENWEKHVVFDHPFPDVNADFENAALIPPTWLTIPEILLLITMAMYMLFGAPCAISNPKLA